MLSRDQRTPADMVAHVLAGYLGPHTARNAVKTFSLKALGRPPETLIAADIPALMQALRPMLRTLIGAPQAEIIVDQLTKEVFT